MVAELVTRALIPHYYLPDVVRNWPWPRNLNPFYATCKAESDAWCESFGAFSPKGQIAFNSFNFSLLASLAFPALDKDGCRIGCDLMQLFFVFDEYSDPANATAVRKQADSIMDAIRNPHTPRPRGEWVGGELARQFWENAIKTSTPTFQRRFIDTFQEYTDSVVEQALDRDTHNHRNIKQYFDIRRATIGARPSMVIHEVHFDIPDDVKQHPSIVALELACVDMIAIGNDLFSYNIEQARGDDEHNLITIVMREHRCNLTKALEWISDLHDSIADSFLSVMKSVPSFGDPLVDEQVATYIDGLGNWIKANEAWSFESERYFGTRGLEVQRIRIVELLPRRERFASDLD